MVALNIRKVPDELAREFKALCVRGGRTMTAEIQRLMAEELRRAEKGGKGK